MAGSFYKKLRYSEAKWNFIYIPAEYRDLFPKGKTFKVMYKGRAFQVSVGKANRIVSKKLFQEIKPRKGSVVTISKKSDHEYDLTIE